MTDIFRMSSKRTVAVIVLFAFIIFSETFIGLYVFVNVTDTELYLLNPPEEPEALSFTLLCPSESVLFPILPINTTEYVYLNITLNYVGEISERQPVNLTVSGFMTKSMANKADMVFVEFRGAVPYNNGSSTYGPWFSGAVLQIDHVAEEGHVVFKNDTVTIVWNVQGYYNPVVVIRDKHTGDEYLQEYADFPVYVVGFGDFQQAKSNKINTALSIAAFLFSVVFSVDLLLKLYELREKNGLNQLQAVTNVKSGLDGNNTNMEENKEIDKNTIDELVRFVDCKEFVLFRDFDVFKGVWGITFASLVSIFGILFVYLVVEGVINKTMPLPDQITLALSTLGVFFAYFALTTKIGENHVIGIRFKRAIRLKHFTEDEKPILKALIKLRSRNPKTDLERISKLYPEMFTKEKLLEKLYADTFF